MPMFEPTSVSKSAQGRIETLATDRVGMLELARTRLPRKHVHVKHITATVGGIGREKSATKHGHGTHASMGYVNMAPVSATTCSPSPRL